MTGDWAGNQLLDSPFDERINLRQGMIVIRRDAFHQHYRVEGPFLLPPKLKSVFRFGTKFLIPCTQYRG